MTEQRGGYSRRGSGMTFVLPRLDLVTLLPHAVRCYNNLVSCVGIVGVRCASGHVRLNAPGIVLFARESEHIVNQIKRLLVGLFFGLGPLAAVLLVPGGAALAAPTCVDAGSSGMTAVVVATSGQMITGTIDATGCDVGVYVGPIVTGVTIQHASISGANEHAILVQDTVGTVIQHNTITGNVSGGGSYAENEAILVEGSSTVMIQHNTVSNNGGGGIAITDDGSTNPGGPNAGLPLPGSLNMVVHNTVSDNTGGNGIIVAAYNTGGGVSGNILVGNVVENNPTGIVITTEVDNASASGNKLVVNSSNNNGAPGIGVYSNFAGAGVTGTMIVANRLSGNATAAIELSATGTLDSSMVVANRGNNNPAGILESGDTNTRMVANRFN